MVAEKSAEGKENCLPSNSGGALARESGAHSQKGREERESCPGLESHVSPPAEAKSARAPAFDAALSTLQSSNRRSQTQKDELLNLRGQVTKRGRERWGDLHSCNRLDLTCAETV